MQMMFLAIAKKRYHFLILTLVIGIYVVFSSLLIAKYVPLGIKTIPTPGSYRSDEFIFLRTYYGLKEGKGYYAAFREAVEGDARGIRLVKDVFTWRMPTIFYLWFIFAPSATMIPFLFVILSSIALVAIERIAAKFISSPLSVVSALILLPYFWDSFYYGTSFLFTEWWGMLFFILGLAFLFYEKSLWSWIFMLLAVTTRELFLFPLLLFQLISLLLKKNRLFFLSIIFSFFLAYFFHSLAVSWQPVPDYRSTLVSRLHQFDSHLSRTMIAFSMRQYPLLRLQLPLFMVVTTLAGLIVGILRHGKHPLGQRYLYVFASISLIAIAPFIADTYNDYWGIMFMPLILTLFPIFLLKLPLVRIWRSFWPLVVLGVWTVLFFRGIIFGDKIFFAADIPRQYFPWYVFSAISVQKGELPLWSEEMQAGYPLFSEGESGALYPILQAVFLFFSSQTAFNLLYPIHFFLLSLFTYTYLRTIKATQMGSLSGALAFSFGLFFVTKIIHPSIIMSGTWFPLGIVIIHTFLTQEKKIFLFLPLIILLQVISGHPQIASISIVGYTAYFFLVLFTLKGRRAPPQTIIYFLLMVLIGLFLSAVQIVPLWELAKYSSRTVSDKNFIFSFSLPISHLITFVLPNFFGLVRPDEFTGLPWYGGSYWEFALYVGLLPFLLGISSLVRQKTKVEWVLTILTVLFLILAIGGYLKLYRLAIYLLTLFINFPFRVSSRFLMIATFALASLSALSFDRFIKRWLVMVFFLVFIALDLYGYGYSYNKLYDRGVVEKSEIVQTLKNDLRGRIFTKSLFLPLKETQNTLQPNLNLLWQIPSLAITSPLPLSGYQVVLDDNYLETVLPRLGVERYLEINPARMTISIRRIEKTMPRVYLTDQLTIIKSKEEAWEHLITPEISSMNIALEQAIELSSSPGLIGETSILTSSQQAMVLRAKTNKTSILVLLDSFYPGWQTIVNGYKVPLLRVNGLVRGVFLEAGKHFVFLRYLPTSLLLGSLTSLIASTFWLTLVALTWKRIVK